MPIIPSPNAAGITLELYQDTCAAYFSGQQRVKYQDKEIWYKSNAEMEAAIRRMEKLLGLAPANTIQRVTPTFSKGLK